MKAKMRIPYRHSFWFAVGGTLVLALLWWMAYVFIVADHDYGFGVMCLLLSLVIPLALWFQFHYGITITDKKVVLIEQSGIRVLPYDQVSEIRVAFFENAVRADVKTKKQEEIVFVWDRLFLGSSLLFPSFNAVRLTPKIIKKSMEELSKVPKVKIRKFYED